MFEFDSSAFGPPTSFVTDGADVGFNSFFEVSSTSAI